MELYLLAFLWVAGAGLVGLLFNQFLPCTYGGWAITIVALLFSPLAGFLYFLLCLAWNTYKSKKTKKIDANNKFTDAHKPPCNTGTNITKDDKQAEKTKAILQHTPKVFEAPSSNEKQKKNTVNEQLSTSFYDAMFGPEQLTTELNAIEQKALENVRNILNNPEKLSYQIPPLPTVLLKLINILKDENAQFSDLAEVIEKDPSLALEVLRIANTALYFTGNGEITSLQKAVSVIGITSIASISSTILLEKIRPMAPIYYKMFGKQIWIHSMQCAFLCKALANDEKQDEFDAYFIGLIHDIGKIIIFNCLSEALSSDLTGGAPGTRAYKELMSEMSADISFFIAQEWGLPTIYCDALQAHRDIHSSSLATLLYKGNLLSEIYLLVKKKALDDTIIDNLLTKLAVDKQVWTDFIKICPEIEKHV